MSTQRELYVDLQGGLDRVRGNKTLYRRMLGLFINSQEFAQLEQALPARDCEDLARIAHGIKGMTGNLSLTKLFEDSTAMMNRFREGVYDEAAVALYQETLKQTLVYVDEVMQELA